MVSGLHKCGSAQCPVTSLLHKEAESQSHCTTLICCTTLFSIIRKCQRSRGAPFSCAPTRPGEGTAHTPHGQESGPVDRIYRALRPARQQPQQESLQPHRHTTGPAHQRRWQPIERGPHSHSAVTDRRKSARHQRTAPPSRLSSSATPIAGHGRRRR